MIELYTTYKHKYQHRTHFFIARKNDKLLGAMISATQYVMIDIFLEDEIMKYYLSKENWKIPNKTLQKIKIKSIPFIFNHSEHLK